MSTVSPSLLTSESVSEGYPDKVCDDIADAVLNACLADDPESRVACEVLCKDGRAVVAGEVTTSATLDAAAVTRATIRGGSATPIRPSRSTRMAWRFMCGEVLRF